MKGHSAHRYVGSGHTILELILSLVLLSLITASVSSVVIFASSADTDDDSVEATLADDSKVLSQIAEDISLARYVIELGESAVTVVVSDRTGDGVPDRIRYAWSGVQGEPLFYQLNDESAVALIDSLEVFSLTYENESHQAVLPVASLLSEEKTIDSSTRTNSASEKQLKKTEWYGQAITPELSENAVSFVPTRLRLYSFSKSLTSGQALLEFKDLKGTVLGSVVYADETIDGSALLRSYDWHDIELSKAEMIDAGQEFAFTISNQSGLDELLCVAEVDGAGGLMYSDTKGRSWEIDPDKSLAFELMGQELIVDPQSYTVTQTRLPLTTISLQRVATERRPLTRRVRMLLAPPLLDAFAETDFDINPTSMDLDADGQPEWSHDSETFPEDSIESGIWVVDGALAYKSDALSSLDVITVTARMRSNDTFGPAIYGPYTVDSLGKGLPLITQLREDGKGGQELLLYNAFLLESPIATISGLSEGLVDIKLTLLPKENYLSIQVNHEDVGTYMLQRVSDPGTIDQGVEFRSTGGIAEIDSVIIRGGGTYIAKTRLDGAVSPESAELLLKGLVR